MTADVVDDATAAAEVVAVEGNDADAAAEADASTGADFGADVGANARADAGGLTTAATGLAPAI